MESCRALALCALAAALLLSARGQGLTPPRRGRDLGSPSGGGGSSREKELIEALQEVLEKLKSKRVPHYEKKFGQVPMELMNMLYVKQPSAKGLFGLASSNKAHWELKEALDRGGDVN
ncbi:cocaine- and amphetamine-regulated transcript protein isoform X1 [Amazona aestiva]|uniref:Cocaine-and amphetamine-regulated transcript protein isoform X1 n=1 Tax=Amazona aestiva TaxID=12930 RepID=A0A0Q3Q3R9_AMAAE|nr:cocaine- and amphetamine-regulated transcript protein isoform X1 [Amazona aestiva]